jgi:subtilisin family serine protease
MVLIRFWALPFIALVSLACGFLTSCTQPPLKAKSSETRSIGPTYSVNIAEARKLETPDEEVPDIQLHDPKEITVMVIDTGIDRHPNLERFLPEPTDPGYKARDYEDNHGHGTHVAGIVVFGNTMGLDHFADVVCPQVRIISCKYYDPKDARSDNLHDSIECVKRATKLHVDLINYSGGGLDYSKEEQEAYQAFIDAGGIVVAATGNEYVRMAESPYYPASYGHHHEKLTYTDGKTGDLVTVDVLKPNPGYYYVENLCWNGKPCKPSNVIGTAKKQYGERIFSTLPHNRFGTMTGTSQATPAFLHRILKKACKERNWGIQ